LKKILVLPHRKVGGEAFQTTKKKIKSRARLAPCKRGRSARGGVLKKKNGK